MSERTKNWPRTVEEAVEQLISYMSEEDKETLRNTPEKDLIYPFPGCATSMGYLRPCGGRRDLGAVLL